MKKTFSLLVLIGIGLALSSCGGGGGDSKSKDKKDTSVVKDAGDILSSSSTSTSGNFAPKSLSEVVSITYNQTDPISWKSTEKIADLSSMYKYTLKYTRNSNTQATISYSSTDAEISYNSSGMPYFSKTASEKVEFTTTLTFTSATKGTYSSVAKTTNLTTEQSKNSNTARGTFELKLK